MFDEKYIWFGIAGFLFILILFLLYQMIGIFMISLFLYYASRPLFRWMEDYIDSSSIRSVASISIFILPMLLVLLYTVTVIINDLLNFYGSELTKQVLQNERLVELAREAVRPEKLTRQEIVDAVQLGSEQLFSSIGIITSLFIKIPLVLILVYYLLKDDDILRSWFENNIKVSGLSDYLVRVDKELQSIYFGNVLTIFVISIISSFIFYINNFVSPEVANIPYPFLLGLVCGISSIIPIVGMKIVYVPVYLYTAANSFLSGSPELVVPIIIMLIITIFLVDLVPETFIRPYMSKGSMHLGLVIISYITGIMFFGWYGIFFGPFLLAVIYHFCWFIVPEKFS